MNRLFFARNFESSLPSRFAISNYGTVCYFLESVNFILFNSNLFYKRQTVMTKHAGGGGTPDSLFKYIVMNYQ